MEYTSHHCLEAEDGSDIEIKVEWEVKAHRERHEVGDGYAWEIWNDYTPIGVTRTDTDDWYDPDEDPSEDWHYLFQEADVDGSIQP